jgi:hypothetical protein
MCCGLVIYAYADLFIILQYTKKILPDVTVWNHIKNLLPLFVQSLLMGLGIFLFINIFTNLWFQLIGGVIIGTAIYFLLSMFMSKKELQYIINLVKRK